MTFRLRPAALLALGSVALVAGVLILLSTFAPYFINPTSALALALPQPSLAFPASDTAAVVAPAGNFVVPAVAAPEVQAAAQTPVDGVWFEMKVPAIGYSGAVRQGVGLNVLDGGPGHYPTTPWPGQTGNVGIAGHNTFWLSFSHLKSGDRVEIRTQHGLYVYQITGSKVVNPTDRSVLAATSDNRLTLTTCYPLWAGAYATQRLIFTAREIGGVG
ncbi:MAG TPA: class D sortase [Candidatus Dormibacteraeota bacterium]|jgi:sortase A|nr:class D sortase [Candidatus Dormibacteraeota bacterium]